MKVKMSSFFSWFKDHWKLTIFIALLLVGGGFWYYSSTKAQAETLIFIKPQRENLVKTLEVSGKVDATQKARLRFASGGKITFLGAQQGDTVTKGKTLVIIDQSLLRKQLQQELNASQKERTDWEQTQDNTKDRVLPTSEQRTVQKEQIDLNNAVLDVEIQNISIRNTVLSAPFEGILTFSPTAVTGVQVLASDYFEVINPRTLKFIAEVDESDIGKVQTGQQAELILDAYPDEKITSYVGPISFTSTNGANGTVFEVTFLLDYQAIAQQLRIGMNGDISITLETKDNALSIPIIATRERDGEIFVDVRTGQNTAEERKITTGLETDEKIEVLSGLNENDELVSPE